MKPIERQIRFEEVKSELTVLNFLKRLLKLKSWARTLFWVSVGVVFLFWLAITVRIIPQTFSWAGLIFLAPISYSMFKQSELYRLRYYKERNLQAWPWSTRMRVADLERFRDSLKSRELYQREDIKVFTKQTRATLELRYAGSVWRHPLLLFALGFTANALFQSLSGMGVTVNSALLTFLVFALLFVLTVVPLIYDIATGERQLLNRLLLLLITVSSDFREQNPDARGDKSDA